LAGGSKKGREGRICLSGIGGGYPRVLIGTLLVLSIAAAVFFLAVYRSDAVVGPDVPYTEANGDTIEICADAACTVHTTTFNPGDTVYLRVTTSRVVDDSRRSRLELYDYLRNRLLRVSWTQTSTSAPFTYEGSFTLPASIPDYVKVSGEIRDGPGARFRFEQQLEITGLNQYTRLYSDAARSDESYTFAPGATMYVRAYGNGNAYSAGKTGRRQNLRDFSNGRIKRWNAPTVVQNGNWYDFSLTLPSGGMTDGDWYWLELRLRDNSKKDILRMSRMVQIDGSPPTAAITSPATGSWATGALPVQGTADDSISFYNYVLEYGAGASPASWTQITSSTTPVTAGLLGTWDTTAVADGLYTIRLTATDRAYNTATDSVQVNVDNTYPVISTVQAGGITSSSAVVTWDTDEAADSQVEYGTSPGVYTWSTPLDPTMVTSHSQPVSGLQQATTYYYRVRSADQAGNTSYSAEYSFKTANITVLQPFPALGRDTYIGSARPTWNHGAETSLEVGDIGGPDWGSLRGMLGFDLAGIPATATINSATMSLYQMGQEDTSTPTLEAHYLTSDWSEGTGTGSATGDGATWNTYDGANPWTTAGGDFNAGASASATGSASNGVWVDWDVSTLTQSWVSGALNNYGLLLKQDVENPAVDDAKEFYTSEYEADRSLRPKLTIEWLGDDVAPPDIGEVRAENITATSADIKWSTYEGGTSQVDYGTTTSYGSTTALDPAIVNQHTVSLPGLTADTIYHYRVRSRDASGNESVSGDYSFQTARQIVIQPGPAAGKDDFFQSNRTDLNSGAATWLLAGDWPTAFWGTMRSTLQFDLSAIPAGSTINSATLSLYQAGQGDNSTPTLDAHYLTRNWTEGTGIWSATGDGATWGTYDGVNNWTSPGGDYNPTPSASAVAPNSTAAWVNWDLTSLTQSWVDGSIANNGVLIKQDVENPAGTDIKLYISSDYTADPSLRPKLVIEYIPAPGTLTMTIDETWNRDGTPGTSSVGFGNVNEGMTYYVGDTPSPPYAVKLTVKSNALWRLETAASGDLVQSNPANFIDIASLAWKQDAQPPASYQSFVKSPSSTVVASGLPATNARSFLFDFRLMLPTPSVSGAYTTSVVYTASPE